MALFQTSGGVRWLVVCLGNPGLRYEGTRHNAGFMTADALAKKLDLSINRARFHALTGKTEIGGESVLVMKPQTYMNLSGEAVRSKGSAGGHNGLKSIIACLGSDQFPRIRLGVGAPPHADYDMADWVLSAFKNQDAEEIAQAAGRAAEAVICYITEGCERTMNKFN